MGLVTSLLCLDYPLECCGLQLREVPLPPPRPQEDCVRWSPARDDQRPGIGNVQLTSKPVLDKFHCI